MEYATWDDRIEKFRIPGNNYREVIEALQQDNTDFVDKAKAFAELQLDSQLKLEPYPHQAAALLAWKQAGRQGVIVLPTGAGKTLVAQLAMAATPAQYADFGADDRSDASVVRTVVDSISWYGDWVARRWFARSIADFDFDLW